MKRVKNLRFEVVCWVEVADSVKSENERWFAIRAIRARRRTQNQVGWVSVFVVIVLSAPEGLAVSSCSMQE